MNYAGFGRRLAAFLIDSLFLSILMTVLGVVLGLLFGAAAAANSGNLDSGAVDAVAAVIGVIYYLGGFVAAWLYYALAESSGAMATIGKRAVGIHVTDDHGRRLTFGRASGRYFGKYLSSMTMMIGWLMPLFTKRHQALHDLVAGTVVLRTPTPGAVRGDDRDYGRDNGPQHGGHGHNHHGPDAGEGGRAVAFGGASPD